MRFDETTLWFVVSAIAPLAIVTLFLLMIVMSTAIHALSRRRAGVLSDRSILELVRGGELGIRPFHIEDVQPSSIDLRLGGDKPLVLRKGEFKLATSEARISIPSMVQGNVHGRSSIGRLGVLVHFTAGLIDPGFDGDITFECMAVDEDQTFYPGDRIAQLTLLWLDYPASHPYSGRYQGQRGITASRFMHTRDE